MRKMASREATRIGLKDRRRDCEGLGLSEKQIDEVELAGLLHDIGKIGIEDRVLMKPSRLDSDEKLN